MNIRRQWKENRFALPPNRMAWIPIVGGRFAAWNEMRQTI